MRPEGRQDLMKEAAMGVASERRNGHNEHAGCAGPGAVPDELRERYNGHDEGPLKFERRACERWSAIGQLEAVRCDGMGRSSLLRLDLVDESAGGLAAVTRVPMPPGSRLSVRSAPNSEHWRPGVVVRCCPSGSGYRIGVAYERRQAA